MWKDGGGEEGIEGAIMEGVRDEEAMELGIALL